eukprot:gene15365-16942_t
MAANITFFNTTVSTVFNTTVNPGTGPYLCDFYTRNGGQIAYAVFLAIILVLCLLGNSLVCIAIALSPRLRENPTNYFIISLAVSDMCYAIFQSPIRISVILLNQSFCFNENVCYFFILTDIICTPATISTLFVIAIDRCMCITMPFLYQEHMSKGKAKMIVVCVWIYAGIWSLLSSFSWESPFSRTIKIAISKTPTGIRPVCMNTNRYFYLTSYFIVTLIPLVIMGATYIIILRVAVIQIRAIRATEVHIPQEQHLDGKDKRYAKMSKSSRRTNRELKATATLAIVYGVFFICWFPPAIINILIGFQSATGLQSLAETNPPLFGFIYYTFMEVLPTVSTAVNPIIYNIFNRQFRTAFKIVIMRLMGRKDALRSTMVTEFDISRHDHTNHRDAASK